MEKKSKKIRFILVLYWILLAYILAALVWWYIALTRQNHAMGELKKAGISVTDTTRSAQFAAIEAAEKRKMAQYIGEGSIFLLLIGAGAIILFRAINKQLKLSREQQHFMMAITHELKTPIAVSRLNLETLQKRKLEEAQQQKLINSALQETNRMNDLCSNLLLSSQMEGGGYAITKEKIDASTFLKSLITAFKNRYPERKTTEQIEEDIFIVADSFLLQMAINNLIDNANKYSPKDGLITIMMNKDGEQVFISVIDEGNGIADEDKVKIFEKFYRTGSEANKKSKGTGLGLYLVQRIIRTHQGMVMVTDNKPKGSKFVIKLKTIAS